MGGEDSPGQSPAYAGSYPANPAQILFVWLTPSRNSIPIETDCAVVVTGVTIDPKHKIRTESLNLAWTPHKPLYLDRTHPEPNRRQAAIAFSPLVCSFTLRCVSLGCAPRTLSATGSGKSFLLFSQSTG